MPVYLLYASYFALLGIAGNVVMIPSLHCFLKDENGPVTHIELDCLKPHISKDGVIEGYAEDGLDLYLYTLENIIAGPLVVENPPKRRTWRFPDIFKVKKFYEEVKDLDRKSIKELHFMAV